jgi:hypothetical protein
MRTLCAFLNGSGGAVLFGVRLITNEGRAYERVGSTSRRMPQQIADQVVGRLGADAVPSPSQAGTKPGPSRDQVGTKSKFCGSAARNGPWLN